MNLKALSLNQIILSAISVFKRFPLSVIATTLVMIIMILLVENSNYRYHEEMEKIAFVSSLGIFMFTALRLLNSRLICLFGIVVLAIYYFILSDSNIIFGIILERHFFLIVMFFIMILWANYWKMNPSNVEFWEWHKELYLDF